MLYVDYNELEDSSASCLLVAIASARTMQTLDMECVGATDSTAQVALISIFDSLYEKWDHNPLCAAIESVVAQRLGTCLCC